MAHDDELKPDALEGKADEKPAEEKTPDEKAAEVKAAKEKEWDKQRQEVDQANANVRKIAEEKLALSEQVGVATERAESLQTKVSALETKLADKVTQKEQETKLDPDLIDPTLIKVIDELKDNLVAEKELLEEQQKEIKDLKETKAKFLEERKVEQEKTAQDERKETILSKLDERYSPKYRNDAIKLAQEKVDASGKAPVGELDVYLLLDKCYEEIAAKAPKDVEKKVRVDTGEAGVIFKEGDIKEGGLEDVWNQMKPKLKGKLEMPSP